MYHKSCHDRRALLAYVDALRAAAGKVACARCDGQGGLHRIDGEFLGDCPDCTDLRRLLGEKP
jgi:hypothetical protein